MNSKRNPAKAKELDVKTQLEAITGQKIALSVVDLPTLWTPSATYSLINQGSVTSYATHMNVVLGIPKHCDPTPVLDVSGDFLTTGEDGKATFHLTDFVCLGQFGYVLVGPMTVVATPISAKPVFVTVQHIFTKNNIDIQITVLSWDACGAPAPGISFDWRCQVGISPVLSRL